MVLSRRAIDDLVQGSVSAASVNSDGNPLLCRTLCNALSVSGLMGINHFMRKAESGDLFLQIPGGFFLSRRRIDNKQVFHTKYLFYA